MFYLKLALNNIRQSSSVFAPFVLANIVLYLLVGSTLVIMTSPMSDDMRYGIATLSLAIIVLVIFAIIMSLYSYNFLLKQRSREFGLYNMLGMNKRKIGLLSTIELFIVFLATISLGSVLCAVFSNLIYLIFVNLAGYEQLQLQLTLAPFIYSSIIFGFIFVILEIVGLSKIGKSSPLVLFSTAKAGEKEPRGNLLLAFLGVLFLGIGYYLSISSSRIAAVIVLYRFFIAVLFVIAGTYLFYISFIAWYLKRRRANKSYFYKPDHFITTSQMIFRMKQNAVGLANITLLAVMAFVTIATTTSLYSNASIVIESLFPKNTNITFMNDYLSDQGSEALFAENVSDKLGLSSDDVIDYTTVLVGLPLLGVEEATITSETIGNYDINTTAFVYLISQDDFEKFGNKQLNLAKNQTAFYHSSGKAILKKLSLFGVVFDNVSNLTSAVLPDLTNTYNSGVLVVSDREILKEIQSRYSDYIDANGGTYGYTTQYMVDLTDKQLSQLNIADSTLYDDQGEAIASVAAKKEYQGELSAIFGGFLFTGFLLGLSFLLGAALIIYYKQYSEGHEDKKSYTILQEVGMDKKQVKKTINAQVLLVFFMPIAIAILHFLAALTMLKQMLLLFGVTSSNLIYTVSGVSIVVIMAIYFIIYKLTSRTYYKIIER